MKIEARRLFTYPVQADERDDYKSNFNADIKTSIDAANNLLLEIFCRTDCAEINRLISGGDAEYLLHVECPSTIYRTVVVRGVGNFSCKIPLSLVKEKIYLAALIVLRRDVKNFSCRDWNEDFSGLTFDLQKGSVLAYKNFQPVTLAEDPNLFKNVSSIFSVYKKLANDAAPFEIEMTSQKIKIRLGAKEYDLYRRYCENRTMLPILNALIILPPLITVFDELKADAQAHGSDAWFLSLQAAYRRRNLDLTKLIDAEDSLKLAQEIMNLPLTKALESFTAIFSDATEDY